MKILHTADWHIGQFKGPVVDGVNLRSQDTVHSMWQILKQKALLTSRTAGFSRRKATQG